MATVPTPLTAAEFKETTPVVVSTSKASSVNGESHEDTHEDERQDSALRDIEKEAQDKDLALQRTKSMEYPPFKAAVIIMLSIYLTVFLVALDRTIIGTAVPSITNDFHSFDDIAWYASSYQLTACEFSPSASRASSRSPMPKRFSSQP